MPAGQSAHDVARRKRERAERLQRSAELWEKGAQGEVAVARALEALPKGWVVFHDLAWPGRERANIDHVVIGPGGVFVVDAKNWSGRVEVRDQVLLQNGRRRENTVVSAGEASDAVQGIVPASATCSAVLCFVRDEQLHGRARDVVVCTTSNVVAMLASRPVVLDPDAVHRCAEAVRAHTSSGADERGRGAKASSAASRKRRTPWLKVVAALTVLTLFVGGALDDAIEWGSERLVKMITDAPPTEPPPVRKARQDRGGAKKGQRTQDSADRQG